MFDPVTASRMHGVLRRNRELLEVMSDELQRLTITLAGTTGTAFLTNAKGVIIGSTFTQVRSHERLMPACSRIGINVAEAGVGTSAPGISRGRAAERGWWRRALLCQCADDALRRGTDPTCVANSPACSTSPAKASRSASMPLPQSWPRKTEQSDEGGHCS